MPPLISNDGSVVNENNKPDETEHKQQSFSINNNENNYTELIKEIELTNRNYMNLLTK